MTDLTICLRNGEKIEITVRDPEKFYASIADGVVPEATHNFCAEGPYFLQLSEIAAIYPSEREV